MYNSKAMLNVTKEPKGTGLLVKLVGTIEESVDMDKLIGPTPKELTVSCKQVTRINSVGVKAWIKYFQELQKKGTQLTFTECSISIVEQLNLISNFACGGKVESMYVPYACPKCGAELVGLFKVEDLKKLNYKVPNLKCTKCGSPEVAFDDIPEEYFSFLSQS